MSSNFYSLKVAHIQPETSDTVSVTFAVPADLKDIFRYTQGQYLTLRFTINGKEERRAYSMCSSPLEEGLTVAVKRVKSGKVSNHINDKLKVGDSVEVMPPEGRFFSKLDPDNQKTYYMIGAGSGITPLFSMIKTILETEPRSFVYLFYGNRDEDSIIFKGALDAIQDKYEGQIEIIYLLSQPKRAKDKGLRGLFSKGSVQWAGIVGRLEEANLTKLMDAHTPRHKFVAYFICGPGDMIAQTEAVLRTKGVEPKNIHAEYFSSPSDAAPDAVVGMEGAKVTAHLDGSVVTIAVPPGKNILAALIDNKYDPPYSCTSGACSTCMAKVLTGETKMEVCYALDAEEVAQGYILTCQAHPVSETVEITFEV